MLNIFTKLLKKKKPDLTKLQEAYESGLITKEEMLKLKYERALNEYKDELTKVKQITTGRKPRAIRSRK